MDHPKRGKWNRFYGWIGIRCGTGAGQEWEDQVGRGRRCGIQRELKGERVQIEDHLRGSMKAVQ